MYLIKRSFDLIFSILLVTILSPLLLFIAILIKITSEGPAIFKQKRLGKNGQVFTIYKFRTMVENAEKIGAGIYIRENDKRITRLGRILRKTSLDEVPQLFNIIKNEMSFVGPRPPLPYHPYKYEDYSNEQKLRFTVLPGITGCSQIKVRNNASWDEKIKLDIEYVKKHSLLLDLKIIIITVYVVIKRKNIYKHK